MLLHMLLLVVYLILNFLLNQVEDINRRNGLLDKALQEDGRIYLDAMFSPVRKVTFDVEKTRVGKEIDYDKLIIAYSILMVLKLLLKYCIMQFLYCVHSLSIFLATAEIPFNEISAVPEEEKPVEPDVHWKMSALKGIPVEFLLKPIDELEFSVRAHNCLINAGIKRIIDLVNLSEDEVLKIKNFGRKSLNEVKEAMKHLGFHLV